MTKILRPLFSFLLSLQMMVGFGLANTKSLAGTLERQCRIQTIDYCTHSEVK